MAITGNDLNISNISLEGLIIGQMLRETLQTLCI